MQAECDELIHVRLTGPLAKLMAQVDPAKCEKFTHHEKGTPVLCAGLKKGLRGTLQAALLFWQNLSSTLEQWGFKLNEHDNCVANADIEGSQCTILWHVDDLKMSHVNPKVVTNIIARLERKCGQKAPLTVTRGKAHDYLGMTIDFSSPGKVIFRMDDCAKGILSEARDEPIMEGNATDPAAEHLFVVNNDNPDELSTDDAEHFHTMVAKMLFVSERARPDVQQAIAFLTTRVSGLDTDDHKKLA